MSAFGTFETCRPALKMSVYRGKPERLADGQNDEIDPEQTIFAKPIDATDLN
jgi:hypothetical protein